MKIEKEHVKRTLMGWSKTNLVERIIMLEHNNNALQESFDIQYSNCMKMIEDMNALTKRYNEAKKMTCASALHNNLAWKPNKWDMLWYVDSTSISKPVKGVQWRGEESSKALVDLFEVNLMFRTEEEATQLAITWGLIR